LIGIPVKLEFVDVRFDKNKLSKKEGRIFKGSQG
jgi:hypothetical protein